MVKYAHYEEKVDTQEQHKMQSVHIKEFTVNFGPPLLHRINQLMAVGRILGHG